jgi:hypothetical protein
MWNFEEICLYTYNRVVQKNVQTQSSKINDGKEWTYQLVDLEVPHLHQCVFQLLWVASTCLPSIIRMRCSVTPPMQAFQRRSKMCGCTPRMIHMLACQDFTIPSWFKALNTKWITWNCDNVKEIKNIKFTKGY